MTNYGYQRHKLGQMLDDQAIENALDNTFWKKWTGTQAEYDAIAVKDPDTLYVIVG